jgi:hypothetical protein
MLNNLFEKVIEGHLNTDFSKVVVLKTIKSWFLQESAAFSLCFIGLALIKTMRGSTEHVELNP